MGKDISKIAVFTQARLQSTRIPNKMVEPLFGSITLMDLLCEKFKEIELRYGFSNFFVASHEEELLSYANRYGFGRLERSYESSIEEERPSIIYDWSPHLQAQGYEYVILVSACLPFLRTETVYSFIRDFAESDSEGMLGVVKKKNYYWKEENSVISMITQWPENIRVFNTKYIDPIYESANALYASRIDILADDLWVDDSIPPNPKLWLMEDNLELFDIDYPWQMDVAKKVLTANLGSR